MAERGSWGDVAAHGPKVERVRVSAYAVPTDQPESDGTLEWSETGLVVVEVQAGAASGMGYTYASPAAAELIRSLLAGTVRGRDAFDIPGMWAAMVQAVRNQGESGISAMAISATDVALWDLKAQLLRLPLARLLGRAREAVPVYGSGGFTSYEIPRLQQQLGAWA